MKPKYHRTRREALIRAVRLSRADGDQTIKWIVVESDDGNHVISMPVGRRFVEFKPSLINELDDDVDAIAYLEGCFE